VTFDLEPIGRAGPEHRYEVTDAALERYAEATDDAVGGPVFAIVPVWRTIQPASRSVAPDEELRKYVVHYEHDFLLHRPLAAGMTVVSRATPTALLPRPNGTSLVLKTETRTEGGALLNEQYVTEFFRGVQAVEGLGDRAPDHRLEADGSPLGEVTYPIAEDQTVRYAAASGDDFAIHLDDEFARRVGLPRRIVHGLCTLAFAGRAVLEVGDVREPRSVKRLAVRFSAPLFPGETITTRVWRLDGAFGFDSLNGDGQAVLKDGRAELR
jgi:acyl dehydratase